MRVETMKLEPQLAKEGRIGDYLQVGQTIMVQISKEAISTKGPRLTADVSLAGRNVVLVPFTNKVFVSAKIRSNSAKKRLRKVAQDILPENFGVIIRTAAAEAEDIDIMQDILSLVERWNKTLDAMRKGAAPTRLMSEMSRVNTIIRDSLNDTFSQIIVDDETMHSEIKSYIHAIKPEMEHMVKQYKGKVGIFDNFDITKQIKSLFAKYVSLRRGAYLIIEHTEAMHVIDVNSGNRTKAEDDQEQTALEVNLAAAAEIARQLRLRDMGGIVIVDFIDMRKQQSRQTLYQEMQKLMATDKAKHTILPITKFGLMQITRQRVRPIAMNETSDVCPTCHGTGKVEPTILLEQKIEGQIQLLAEKGCKYVNLRVSPYVAAYLRKGIWPLRMRWIFKYKLRIKLTTDHSIGMIDVSYLDKKGESLLINN
jgi:ribonuclease G